ncbi:MAG TPA: tyrosine--tRNA ligase [Candidatus Paceibacterota bacterium]
MTVSRDPAKIEELLSRGVAEIVDRTSLGSRLRAGKPLRIKLGIDPTSPHLHLGRSIALWKLRDFQELGHQVVLILGDFTGTIGDASDKDAERPVLDQATVDANLETYAAQAGKILDMSRVEVRRNSEWLDKVSYRELCRQADVFSVNDFVSREMVAKRLKEGKRVSLREVLYPLMQGYDSVAVRADVELGGTDQRFNMLAGRDLQRLYGQAPQDIVINALVPGTDGRKMSSSWGNTVNLDEKPREMFQKVMRLADGLVSTYFSVATRVPLAEVAAVLARLEAGENPRDVKMDLAAEIVRVCHGAEAASEARRYFVELFSEGVVPEGAPEAKVAGLSLVEALVAAGIADSKSDARRVIEQKGVKVGGEVCEDPARVLRAGETVERGRGRAVRAI